MRDAEVVGIWKGLLFVLESSTYYTGHRNIPNHDGVHIVSTQSIPKNTREPRIFFFSLTYSCAKYLFEYFLKSYGIKLTVVKHYVQFLLLHYLICRLYAIVYFQGPRKCEKEFNDLL